MIDGNLNKPIPEEGEPLTPDELVRNLLTDLISGNPPSEVANEFIDEFVLQGREETPQVLSMLETPSETLVELLKGIVGQSYQVQIEALENRGVIFVEGLKQAVRLRMKELANETA